MFSILFLKIFHLYIEIFCGFLSGRLLKITGDEIIKFLFFLLAPVVYFRNSANITISNQIFSLPIITWTICFIVTNFTYFVSKFLYKGRVRNILAFSSGSSSTGFFGLPIAVALFDQKTMSAYILCSLGMVIFESTYGYYIVAKGVYTPMECLFQVFKMPSLWGSAFGLVLAWVDVQIPAFIDDFFIAAKHSFTLIGMSVLGISLSRIKKFGYDLKFILTICAAKYILWPALVSLLIYLDKTFTSFFDHRMYMALTLLAIIPSSSSSIVFANVFNNNSDTVAIMLMINTTIGLVYVPIMCSLLMY